MGKRLKRRSGTRYCECCGRILEHDRHRFCTQACAIASLRLHMEQVSQVLPHHAAAPAFSWVSDETLVGIATVEAMFLLLMAMLSVA